MACLLYTSLTLLGIVCLGGGYFIAVTVGDPLNALLLFFVAVLLVIAGTFCLFTSGSIALLKLLRKNKRYYYQPRHFISVAGLMYRMKQNAAGLASICILSTICLLYTSTAAQELFMSAETAHTAIIQNQNPVRIFDGRGALTDHYYRHAPSIMMQRFAQSCICGIVQRGSRIIKN